MYANRFFSLLFSLPLSVAFIFFRHFTIVCRLCVCASAPFPVGKKNREKKRKISLKFHHCVKPKKA